MSLTPPDPQIRAAAATRLGALATPPGALGLLGEVAIWLASAQGVNPPEPIVNPRLVIFAGDHGVAAHGVSAFPPAITGLMVRTFLAGRAGVSALARAHGVSVRVVDLAVDDDYADLPAEVRGPLVAHKVRHGSGAIHLEDALSGAEVRAALTAGAVIAREELAAGADLLMSGDMGIGNTTPATALVAAALRVPADQVTGRGTGIDDATWAHKAALIDQALSRAGDRLDDPEETLAAVGSADLAAATGFLVTAAEEGVPVLLDGLLSVACALTAERMAPGASAWFVAGHRSTEPAQTLALDKLGLRPLLDLEMRLGEGSGAVTALPLLQSSVALLREVALLSEVTGAGD
ncbi:MAG: nicotinate-nucleotide--dimethylbenzimidazole phosphoribosyltransferase [Nocardioides sp.]|uniref:nicotinate-nucleotide--dimethylbenzimidazole phosphoribosyltransferase n=1 Tax=Nocardioides sp. TaxID=35761 RepID=UPI0039E3AA74